MTQSLSSIVHITLSSYGLMPLTFTGDSFSDPYGKRTNLLLYDAKTSKDGRIEYDSPWKCGTETKSVEVLWVRIRETAQRPDSL